MLNVSQTESRLKSQEVNEKVEERAIGEAKQKQNQGCYNENYGRLVDKGEIPTCDILGVHVAAINMEWLIHYLEKNIALLSGDYICVSNVHTTVTSYKEKDYCAIQNGGIMAIPDGGPLTMVGKHRGYEFMQRVTGPDLMNRILEISEEKQYRHFFFGSTQSTIDKIRERLKKQYPNLTIVGMSSPPFRTMTQEEDQELIEMINKANPDFIWVALGAPKQERWMAEHQGKVKGLMIGVGAAFDYFAENIKRAPMWMQEHSLEWLYRLKQDPKRLLKRYSTTNIIFVYLIIRGK